MLLGSSDAIHLGERTYSAVGHIHPAAGLLSGWGRNLGATLGLLGLGGVVEAVRQLREGTHHLQDEERLRREVTAYLTLDLSPSRLPRHDFGRLLCRTVATRSSFARAALLLPDDSGYLTVVGSAGVDDLTVQALNRWGAEVAGNPGILNSYGRAGASSFLVPLERRARQPESHAHTLNCAAMYLIPMRTPTGLLGALAVCASLRPSVHGTPSQQRLHRLMEPLEALALTLTLQLSQIPQASAAKPLHRPHVPRPEADRAPAQRSSGRRRRADHSGAPALGPASHISLQQLAAIAANATSLPSAGPAGVMVGFPAINYDRTLPALAQLARPGSSPGVGPTVLPAPHPWPTSTRPPERPALALAVGGALEGRLHPESA